MLRLIGVLFVALWTSRTDGCRFAESGRTIPNDAFHRALSSENAYPVLPDPITTANNAFVTNDLQAPIPELTGNYKTLLENLDEFAAKNEDKGGYCYWSFQALPPPRGDRAPHWDVSTGQWDQDVEWVEAYGDVAVARLHSRITPGGPLVAAACTIGTALTTRRCANGRSNRSKCVPAITDGEIRWPMAISMWKVGHPDLESAVTDWRADASTGHLPNIEWVMHTTETTATPWNGSMPKTGEIDPPAMPSGIPSWPSSQGKFWGTFLYICFRTVFTASTRTHIDRSTSFQVHRKLPRSCVAPTFHPNLCTTTSCTAASIFRLRTRTSPRRTRCIACGKTFAVCGHRRSRVLTINSRSTRCWRSFNSNR